MPKAVDWVRIRTDIYRDPKVCIMADILGSTDSDLGRYVNQNCQCDMAVTRNVMRNAVVGALVSVWGVMRHRGKRNGDDLEVFGCSVFVVDDVADIPGFGDAMVAAGWLTETEECLVFPNFFKEHNSEPNRESSTKNAERQRRFRERQRNGVSSALQITSRNAPEEKRREESSSSVPSEQQSSVPAALKKRIAKLDLTVEDLSNASKLVDAKLLGEEPEANLNVVAAACHILHQMKKKKLPSPIGLFSAIVSEARWGDITDQQMEEARGKIKKIRNGHGGTEWAKRIAGSIAGGGAARPGAES